MKTVPEDVRAYLARMGRSGGKKSRRVLTAETARDMVRVREARRAFRRFYATCFWSSPADYRPGLEDVPWVAEQLRRYGGRDGWDLAERLCR